MVSALKAANTEAGQSVFSPGDWPTNSETMPAILVTAIHERKESMTRAQPNFTTTASIMVDARLQANNEGDAQEKLDLISDQIEQAILTNYNLIQAVQQVAFVETTAKVNSENGTHIAQVVMIFGLEFFQSQEDYYAPVAPTQVDEVAVHADLQNIYDPTGSYTGSLFPNSVIPAPRTSGPDGRDEGLIDIKNLEN
jgi:hypothetical protein